MRILITGILGFIGSALLDALPKEYHIIGIDNLQSQRYSVLFNLPRSLEFYEEDVTTAPLYRRFKDVDVVIHAAATTDAAGTAGQKDKVWRNNVWSTLNVLKGCSETGAKLIFPSTTSVYGSQENRVDETCEDLRPQSPYAESKLACEQAIRLSDVDSCILRLGTVYGFSGGVRFHTVVQKFIWSAVTGQDIPLWRTAMMQKRPYIHIADAVSAIAHVIHNDLFGKMTYNVLGGNHSPRDVMDIISESRKVHISLVESKILNQLSYEVDCSRFMATGWTPKHNLQDGIGELMSAFKGVNS